MTLLQFLLRLKGVNRDLKLLWVAVFCLMLGFGIYTSSFFNFATEILHIDPSSIGRVEAIRETPGLLCVLVAAITMRVAEPSLASIAMTLMAAGLAAYTRVNSIQSLMIWSFVWSIGMHTWMPIQSSLAMHLADASSKGKRLGQTAAAGSIGSVVGISAVMSFSHALRYQTWFLLAAVSMVVAACVMLFVRRNIGHSEKPRFVFRWKYSLYYALTFLEGCRKQVFFTFAPYALTKVYHTPLRTMALLTLINNVVNMIAFSPVGRMIDRIGERRILLTSYSALIAVFMCYATIRVAPILCVLYCLDNFFYLSTTCLTTYIQKVAAPEDLMPTLSLGVTMNHGAAVFVPLIGGVLWASLGYPVTFRGGAVVVAISLILAARVPRHKVVKVAQ